MIKQFVIIFLLTAFTVQTFNKSLIVFNYFTHTADYAKDCINKAKPMMHCNGRCQMFKKLRQEENNDKQNPERRIEHAGGDRNAQGIVEKCEDQILPDVADR